MLKSISLEINITFPISESNIWMWSQYVNLWGLTRSSQPPGTRWIISRLCIPTSNSRKRDIPRESYICTHLDIWDPFRSVFNSTRSVPSARNLYEWLHLFAVLSKFIRVGSYASHFSLTVIRTQLYHRKCSRGWYPYGRTVRSIPSFDTPDTPPTKAAARNAFLFRRLLRDSCS